MNAVVMGLGEIGRGLVKAVSLEPRLKLVSVVDRAPVLMGKSLSGLVVSAPPLKIIEQLPKATGDCVLLHATGSFIDDVLPELEGAVLQGYHVVSTCEELAWPDERTARLDALCKESGRVVIATGVNPGFVFERLSALLAHACAPTESVLGVRVVDTQTRRTALQAKTGAGLSPEQFKAQVATGRFGHVGLEASARLVARAMGFSVEGLSESIEPILGDHDQVLGLRQIAVLMSGRRETVRLDLTMALGAKDPRDEITLAPSGLTLKIPGGTPGESATFWTTVHAAALIHRLLPGIRTVLDLPLGIY